MVFTKEAPPQSEKTPRLTKLGDLLAEWADEATAAHEAHTTGRPRGPVSGIVSLDRELGGCFQPGLTIMHGGPGVGKTAFALQVAATAGCPALYVSAEMAVLELFRRHTARETETYLGRLKSGEFPPDHSLSLARKAAAAAPDLTFVDATRTYAAPDWLKRAGEAARGDSRDFLIVVDSVHSWAEAAPVEASEYDRLSWALGALRGIAGTLNCPILAIAERNRASMSKGGLSAGAGNRKFEYGAEAMIDLGREDDAAPNANGEYDVTLKLVKNRNGGPGRKVRLLFHGALQRFREA